MGCSSSKNEAKAKAPISQTSCVSSKPSHGGHTGQAAEQIENEAFVPASDIGASEDVDDNEVEERSETSDDDEKFLENSNTFEEQERLKLLLSTTSKNRLDEHDSPQLVSTTFSDPARELVERDFIREVTVEMIDSILVEGASKCLIFGAPAKDNQKGFDNKCTETVSPDNKVGVGYSCKKGHKPESPNQDDFFVLQINDWHMYGVFDGHGPCGHDVSNFVHYTLPYLLIGDQNFEKDPLTTMKRAFRKVHHLLEAAAATPGSTLDCSLSGTTGTVVVHKGKTLYIAHVGDSRAVLARRNPDKTIKGVNLTADHKPNRDEEKSRIEANGGEVRKLEGDIPHRVFIKNRMFPGLAMSRAIGDTIGNSVGVIPDPDTKSIELTAQDVFFMICTDGVWEFFSSQEAVELVAKHPFVQDASEALASESWNRWIDEEDNVVDDVTGIIVYL